MPAVTANNVTINKTDRGISHAPPGNPVNVPEGGTVTACNRKSRRNARVRVIVDGEVTFNRSLRPDECVTLEVGSPELPNAQYTVSDPPAVLKIIGTTGATFKFIR